MQNVPHNSLKEKVDTLERTLLALNCYSNISEAAAKCEFNEVSQSDSAYLLGYLSERSMFDIEALRAMIDAMPDAAKHAPRAAA